jgi:hypothetical protein
MTPVSGHLLSWLRSSPIHKHFGCIEIRYAGPSRSTPARFHIDASFRAGRSG